MRTFAAVGHELIELRLVFRLTQAVEESQEFSEAELAEMTNELKKNEDIRAYPALFRTLLSPKMNPFMLNILLHPYDCLTWQKGSAYDGFDRINIPWYLSVTIKGINRVSAFLNKELKITVIARKK